MTQPLICVVCQRRETRTGMVCDPDRTRIARTLDEIVELYATLDEQLVPGQAAGGERVSGSREAPLPLRVDPLDLTMPAPSGRQVWTAVMDKYGDQIGHQPVAAVLDSWVRDWRDVRGQGEVAPVPTVMTLAHWLSVRLDWACDHHMAVDEFAEELSALVGTLRRTCGTDRLVHRLAVACPTCDLAELVRDDGADYVECRHCGRLWTEDEYRRLSVIAAAEVKARSVA